MPGKYIPPTYREGADILQLQAVRNAIAEKAVSIAPKAKAIARDEGLDAFADAITVEDGTRPKGRPYAYVIADIADGDAYEYGTTNTERRRILGRAAGSAE